MNNNIQDKTGHKANALIRGLTSEALEFGPHHCDSHALGVLAQLVEYLTSANKSEREFAKKKIRDLVTLGSE